MELVIVFFTIIHTYVYSEEISTTTELYTTVYTNPVPSKPLNLTVLSVTEDSMNLGWMEPERANGAIEGYRIYYMFANYTDVQSLKLGNGSPNIHYTLENLRPNNEYKIWVKAFTLKNEGEPSDAVINKTDISGPSAPRILNLTCATQDTIYLQWERPKEFYNTIDFYYINYTSEHSNDSIVI